MPIGTPTVLTQGADNTDRTTYPNAPPSLSPGANRLLLLFAAANQTGGGAQFITSVGGTLGLTWQQVDTGTFTTNNGRISVWWAKTDGAPPTGTLTFTVPATVSNSQWIVLEVPDADLTNPIIQTNDGNGASTAATVSLPGALTADSATFGVVLLNNTTPAWTAGTGHTLIGTQQTGTSPVVRLAVEYAIDSTSPIAFGPTTTTNWCEVAFEVAAAPPATKAPPRPSHPLRRLLHLIGR